jgi:hypothetical protein
VQSARGARTVDSFVRDFVAFTNKRLIAVNVQGLTGKKRDYSSLPYNKIQAWSVDTAGTFDFDAELELWFSGLGKVHLDAFDCGQCARCRGLGNGLPRPGAANTSRLVSDCRTQ